MVPGGSAGTGDAEPRPGDGRRRARGGTGRGRREYLAVRESPVENPGVGINPIRPPL